MTIPLTEVIVQTGGALREVTVHRKMRTYTKRAAQIFDFLAIHWSKTPTKMLETWMCQKQIEDLTIGIFFTTFNQTIPIFRFSIVSLMMPIVTAMHDFWKS